MAEDSDNDVTSDENRKQNNKTGNDDDLTLCDLPWGARWLSFVERVSVGGLSYAVNPQAANGRRLMWGFLVLVGIAFMTYQIYER